MQAIQVQEYGGPEVLTPTELPTPEPGEGEVRIDLAATGVNFIETYQRNGHYPATLPFVPGTEGAGTVSALGPGVDTVRVGERVASVDIRGSYAEQALVAADRVMTVPDQVSAETAAAAILHGLTAHYLLFDSYPIRSGDVVLVHAAAGGMGLLLTQLATRLGAKVIGTVSTPDKEALARQAGAVEVIRYTESDVVREVKRITAGAGVAATYDGVGKDTFEASLACLRSRGTLVLYGASSGAVPAFDPQRLQHAGSVFLTRPTLRHHVVERSELERRSADLFGWIADGSLSIRIHDRYPLTQAGRAHEDLQSRGTTGKLLLMP
jgi:NADPH2:quinone reductase